MVMGPQVFILKNVMVLKNNTFQFQPPCLLLNLTI